RSAARDDALTRHANRSVPGTMCAVPHREDGRIRRLLFDESSRTGNQPIPDRTPARRPFWRWLLVLWFAVLASSWTVRPRGDGRPKVVRGRSGSLEGGRLCGVAHHRRAPPASRVAGVEVLA